MWTGAPPRNIAEILGKFGHSKSPQLATHRCSESVYIKQSEAVSKLLASLSHRNRLQHHEPCNGELPRIKALGR